MRAAAIAATVDITLAVGLGGVIIGLLLARAFTPAREDRANDDPPTDARVYNLDALVSVIETPAVAFDSDLSVAAFNTLALDLYPSIEPGLPLSRISRHPEFLGTLPLVAADGLPRSVEMVGHSPAGRRLRAGIARLSEVHADAQKTVVLVQFRDLSEQDRLAQMRSDFIANASHELRTPLASLRGFIETLQGPASNDEAARRRFLGIMARTGRAHDAHSR